MSKEKSIPSFFLILLLALYCNNSLAFTGNTLSDSHAYSSFPGKVNYRDAHLVIKQINTKTWIKIRYKGGESPVLIYTQSVKFSPLFFVDCIKAQYYTSFISTQHFFLFKLRGPPTNLS